LTENTFVLCAETITVVGLEVLNTGCRILYDEQVVWGPLSFLEAYFIVAEHPLRHPLQIVVSLAHLYGVVLYYTTSAFDLVYRNLAYSRPEAYYLWGYYVFANAFWLFIPACEFIMEKERIPLLTPLM
jgi:cholestenol Delta-isomerase